MKKLLSTLLTLAVSIFWAMPMLAQDDGFDNSGYETYNLYYLEVQDASAQNITMALANYPVTAYVNGEHRGNGAICYATINEEQVAFFQVKVWTKTGDEADKAEFRIEQDGRGIILGSLDFTPATDATHGDPSARKVLTLIPPTGITVQDISVQVGGTANISWAFTPENHNAFVDDSWYTVEYVSNYQPEYFTIEDGVLNAIAAIDNAELTVRIVQVEMTGGPGQTLFEKTCSVTVTEQAIPVTGIVNDEQSDNLVKYVGGSPFSIAYHFTAEEPGAIPTNRDVTVTFEPAEQEVLSYENGLFNILAKGTTNVTITSVDNPEVSHTWTVNVKQHVTSIEVPESLDVYTNRDITSEVMAAFTVLPEDADDKSVTFEVFGDLSSGAPSDVLSYNSDENKFTTSAVEGTAYVLVTSVENPQVQGVITVNVTNAPIPVESVSVEGNDHYFVGEEAALWVEVLPEEADDKTFTAKSSNDAIVTVGDIVDNTVNITPQAVGEAVITVTTNDQAKTAQFTVNVYNKVTGLALNIDRLDLNTNEKYTIKMSDFTVTPADAWFHQDNLTIQADLQSAEGDENSIAMLVVDHQEAGEDEQGTPIPAEEEWRIVGFTPYEYTLSIDYSNDGLDEVEIIIPVSVTQKMTLAAGWNWVGFPYELALDENNPNKFFNDIAGFKEMRSRSAVLHKDPSIGLFGDLNSANLTPGMGFRLNVTEASDLNLKVKVQEPSPAALTEQWYQAARDVEVNAGWNWISSPLARVYDINTAMPTLNEGDVIKSRTGVSTLTRDANTDQLIWEGQVENIVPGECYLLKATIGSVMHWKASVNIGEPSETYVADIINPAPAAAPKNAKAQPVWMYDTHRFANNMGIIAVMDEEMADESRYTMGAFVGSECRGEGKLVNGRWYITAGGEKGEQVSLRLFDRETGETYTISAEGSQTMPFAELSGAYNAPVLLVKGAPTGISEVVNRQQSEDGAAYDLSGRRLNTIPQRGVYIQNGRKYVK